MTISFNNDTNTIEATGTTGSLVNFAGGGAVDSVNGQTGVVVLDAADVGALPTTGGTVTGPTVVQMSSTSTALRVTQTGTGNAFVVEDATNPDSSPFVVNNAGFVGIRTSSPVAALDVNGSAVISDFLEIGGYGIEIASGNSYHIYFSGDTYVGGTGDVIIEAATVEAIRASAATQNVGIGVAPNTSKLAVGGVVQSTTGGFKFPDATTQTTAASALAVRDEGTQLTAAATSLNFTGSGVTATNTGGAVTLAITSGGASSTDIQDFSSVGTSTWTMPASAKYVLVIAIGGGGGGGSGRKQGLADATPSQGGTGAGAGGRVEGWFPAAMLTSTVTVTVGAGSAGGAARTSDGQAGAAGTAGVATIFGGYLRATGGGGGNAGNLAAQGTGTVGSAGGRSAPAVMSTAGSTPTWFTGVGGGNSSGSSGSNAGVGAYGPGGGGGGGGLVLTPTASLVGGNGGLGFGIGGTTTTGGGGTAGNTTTRDGGNGAASSDDGYGGSGGGGGASNHAGNAGNGGTGGYPGGGGGGGGACPQGAGTSSGAGGTGGDGFVRVVTFF